MGANRGGEVDECVELLQLARSSYRQKPGDSELAIVAARPKHDLSPLHGSPERAFGGVVRRLDTLFVQLGFHDSPIANIEYGTVVQLHMKTL